MHDDRTTNSKLSEKVNKYGRWWAIFIASKVYCRELYLRLYDCFAI